MTIPVVLEVQDRWGRTILLTEEVWTDHIQPGHGAIVGQLDAVRETLENPDVVRHDSTRQNAECFYRLGAIARLPRRYVKLVVRFFNGDETIGYAHTAYVSRNIPSKEAPKWQK